MKKLLRKNLTVTILGILLIAGIALAQAPIFRPASGIPASVEEIRLVALDLVQQQHAEIAAQMASETASPATYVHTTDGWIEEAIWLIEAQTALDYWAAKIVVLQSLAQ